MSRGLSWSIEGRDWPNRAHSQFVNSGPLRWHVQVMGSGPPLLLLHGTGAATHSWRDLAPLLSQEFTIVAPDLPGHGFTTGRPAGRMSINVMARAIDRLLSDMTIQPRFVVGHSAGVAIAMRMAIERHIVPKAIIGLNAAVLPFPGLAAKLFPAMARMLFVNPFAPHLMAGLARRTGETGRFLARATGSHIDPDGVEFYKRLLTNAKHVEGAIAMMANWDLEALQPHLSQLAVPTLLIHGQNDVAIPIAAARETTNLLPSVILKPLANLGHLAHEERPEEVAKLILDYAGGIE